MAGITQKYLKEILFYNTEDGYFTWIVNRGRCLIGNKITCLIKGRRGKNYLRTRLSGKQYRLHRLAWLYVHGYMPEEIDHINGNGLDNRLINLREANRIINNQNSRRRDDNKSGITGVFWRSKFNRWEAYINKSHKRTHLGVFNNIFDAACVRKSAEIECGYHRNHGLEKGIQNG